MDPIPLPLQNAAAPPEEWKAILKLKNEADRGSSKKISMRVLYRSTVTMEEKVQWVKNSTKILLLPLKVRIDYYRSKYNSCTWKKTVNSWVPKNMEKYVRMSAEEYQKEFPDATNETEEEEEAQEGQDELVEVEQQEDDELNAVNKNEEEEDEEEFEEKWICSDTDLPIDWSTFPWPLLIPPKDLESLQEAEQSMNRQE